MKKIIICCVFLFVQLQAVAQEKETTPQDTTFTNYEFTLKDGTKMVGQLIDQNKGSYVIKTSNFGTIKISSNQVVSIILQDQKTKVNKNRSANYFENQFGYKYFIFNTAIPVEPKKWFYTNQYIFFSSFTYGISKHVSAGVLFFILDTGNNIANAHTTIVNEQTVIVSSALIIAGIIVRRIQDKHVYIRKNVTIRILDTDYQNLNTN